MGGLNIFEILGNVLTGVTLLFSIIACSLTQWMTAEILSADVNVGLWTSCVEVSGTKTCDNIDSNDLSDDLWTDVKAVRAMTLLGILLVVGAAVCGILVALVLKDKKILYLIAGGLDIAAGLFLMIGFAVFAGEIKGDSAYENYDYGASFALEIVAWILAWIAGGFFVAAKFMGPKQ